MDLQFSVFLTQFWQQAQPPSAGAPKLGFLSDWDFAAAAQGSEACVPMPRAQLCHHSHEQSSNVASLSCHIGATRSGLHPAGELNAAAQLPQHPRGYRFAKRGWRSFYPFTFAVQTHYVGKLPPRPAPPNKYSLQYAKAKVIYEAALAALVPHQVGAGFSHQRCRRPRAPLWH